MGQTKASKARGVCFIFNYLWKVKHTPSKYVEIQSKLSPFPMIDFSPAQYPAHWYIRHAHAYNERLKSKWVFRSLSLEDFGKYLQIVKLIYCGPLLLCAFRIVQDTPSVFLCEGNSDSSCVFFFCVKCISISIQDNTIHVQSLPEKKAWYWMQVFLYVSDPIKYFLSTLEKGLHICSVFST